MFLIVEKGLKKLQKIFQGSILTVIGVIGFLFCVLVIYCIVFNVVRLPGQQGVFILNVLLSDLGTAITAVIRGLGIISKRFVGVTDDGEENWFCYVYPLVSEFIWSSSLLVLLPLTIDRFIAIVFPLKHKVLITPKSSTVLISLAWILALSRALLFIIMYSMGNGQFGYKTSYHRCVLIDYRHEKYETADKVMAALAGEVPLALVSILYIIMAISILKSGRSLKKIIRVSSVIVLTGLIAVIPDTISFQFDITMNYEVAQVFTVTFWYFNCVVDPLVYFFSHPVMKGVLSDIFRRRKF